MAAMTATLMVGEYVSVVGKQQQQKWNRHEIDRYDLDY